MISFLAKNLIFSGILFSSLLNSISTVYGQSEYKVLRLKEPIKIDGSWDKKEWKRAKAVKITLYMGDIPKFTPQTEAKLLYDDNNIYVIFKVKDRYVKSTVTEYNGHVSGDSCVEFFFAPDNNNPLHYFNLEVNAGGTPLIFHVTKPWTESTKLESSSIDQIEIAHSLPKVIDPEISDPVTWTIECRIPLSILKQYSAITLPKPGTVWKANFYKTGSETSNPHWLTWSYVNHPTPNFHLPEYFGKIVFE